MTVTSADNTIEFERALTRDNLMKEAKVLCDTIDRTLSYPSNKTKDGFEAYIFKGVTLELHYKLKKKHGKLTEKDRVNVIVALNKLADKAQDLKR